MPSADEQRFVDTQRVARLATVDGNGAPHVVPVCYAVVGDSLYITIDEKPKKTRGRPLKRLRNIADNPQVAVIIDRYDDDWAQLGWVMLRGHAEILETGEEHAAAQAQLSARYRQYHDMKLADLPVIAVRIGRVVSWGNLDIDGEGVR